VGNNLVLSWIFNCVLNWEPLKPVEDKIKKALKRWKGEFPDFCVEEMVLDVKIGGVLGFGRAGLKVTLKKKKDS